MTFVKLHVTMLLDAEKLVSRHAPLVNNNREKLDFIMYMCVKRKLVFNLRNQILSHEFKCNYVLYGKLLAEYNY